MRVSRTHAVGLVVDIQERLFPHMHESGELLRKSRILLEGLDVLDIPVLATEQYPRGLGPTVEELSALCGQGVPVEKLSFSCCGEQAFLSALEKTRRRQVIICGIEAHVCILQTVLDLLEAGYEVVLVSDCVSSRSPLDRDVALARMRQEGAVLTTCESLLFELTVAAGNDTFKAISKLVK